MCARFAAGPGGRAGSIAAAIAAAAACGDNLPPTGDPLGQAADLTILAHQDDDLILMQPDLYDVVQGGGGITNVYVTAGNGKHGLDLAEPRYHGLLAAYATIAGTRDWACGWIEIAGHDAEHCRLDDARISLVFLGYPDGEPDGSTPDSLLHLWQGDVTSVRTIAERSTSYDRAGIVDALTEIIDTSRPRTLRTLEVASIHGHDHSDHMLVGALAVLATAASEQRPELVSYRGYNVEFEPSNQHPALLDRSLDPLVHYEACATGCAPCGTGCSPRDINPMHMTWMRRHYAIGMRPTASGQLRSGDGCVAATSGGANPVLVDCSTAPIWRLDESGALAASGRCLEVNLFGEIVAGACAPGDPGGRFFLDDEGHLWSGVVPPPRADMKLSHLYCVGQAGGRPRAGLCGGDTAPTWQLVRQMTATPRSAVGISRTGRAVRLASLSPGAPPALCAVEPLGLVCATEDAGGNLGGAVRLDDPAAPLAIEPESLALGDVDRDGMTDACGRGPDGVVCATAATGFHAEPWSPELASSGAATATDRSLTIVRGRICGLTDGGVACIARRGAALGDPLSTWPDRNAALWIGDLDGDGAIDWCAATDAGPACNLARDRSVTDNGIHWGYASGGVIQGCAAEGAIADTATAALADIDGDGRDDLCTLQGDVIACARSLGHGFGPRVPVALVPPGMTAAALWAAPGSLASRPRLCVGDATAIACVDL